MIRRSERLAKKRRRVTVSRVYRGLNSGTLRPEDPECTLEDCIEDIEEYNVEELYVGEEEKDHPLVNYVIYQPEVPPAGEEGSYGEHRAILVPQIECVEGHPTQNPSGLARCTDAQKLVLEDYEYELDSTATRVHGERLYSLPRDNTYGTTVDYLSRSVRNAFSIIPGRPNCYSFGSSYDGKGFHGCKILDAFSLPQMYNRADTHINAWVQNTFDSSTRKLSDGLHMVSTSREEAKLKLDRLYTQLTEFTNERAFIEKDLDEEHILVYRGDPMAKLVFLFKSPNFYDTKDAIDPRNPCLPRTAKSNTLGIMQHVLKEKVMERIGNYCAHIELESGIVEKAMDHMLPILNGNCASDGHDSGVAFLYCIPIYDPEDWGKAKYRKENASVGLGGYRAKAAMSDFPANVMEIFMRYAEIALNLISPAIVVSTSEFTTRCLSVGMNAKRMGSRTTVPSKGKWFTVPLTLGGGGNLGGMSRRFVNYETGDIIEQRTRSWCIRGVHPFLLKKESMKAREMPNVTMVMDRVASKLFEELRMPEYITGRESTLTKFCMTTPGRKVIEESKPGMDAPRAMHVRGNYVCRWAPPERIEGYPVDVEIDVIEDERFINEEEEHAWYKENSKRRPFLVINGGAEFPPSMHPEGFLDTLIRTACAYPGLEILRGIQMKKSKRTNSRLWITGSPVSTSKKSPKQDKEYFTPIPRSHGVEDVMKKEFVQLKKILERKMGPMGKFTQTTKTPLQEVLVEESPNEWHWLLFRKRIIIDTTSSLEDTTSSRMSVDHAIYISCLLEVVERIVYAEAHRLAGVESAPSVGSIVRTTSKRGMEHVECLKKPGYEDVPLLWIEGMMTVGMKVKETLESFAKEIF